MFTKLWMQREVIQVSGDTTIGEAKEILTQHGFRHLPVTENKKLLGIITSTDINKAMPSPIDSQVSPEDKLLAQQVPVSTFMTNNPVTVTTMTPVEEVARYLQQYKIGAIPVIDDGLLIGIITESDIFAAFSAIMEGEEDDTRMEMLIDKGQSTFYKVIECCQRFQVNINSLSLYHDYSSDQQLMTIRLNGLQCDNLVEAIWDLGVTINQISRLKDD